MAVIRYGLVMLLIVMLSACSNSAQGPSSNTMPDNQENRLVVAKRFLEVMPPKAMLDGIANRVAQNLPEKDRKVFLEVMKSKDMDQTAYKISLDALVKHFTVGELNAMAVFYGSPEGQSAYKKFGPYMGEVMPQIQQQVKKAVDEAQKQEAAKEPPKPKEQVQPPAQKDQAKPDQAKPEKKQ